MDRVRSVTPFRIAVKDTLQATLVRTGWRRWPKHDGLGKPKSSSVALHYPCHFRMPACATELEKSPFAMLHCAWVDVTRSYTQIG